MEVDSEYVSFMATSIGYGQVQPPPLFIGQQIDCQMTSTSRVEPMKR